MYRSISTERRNARGRPRAAVGVEDVQRHHPVAALGTPGFGRRNQRPRDTAPLEFWRDDDIRDVAVPLAREIVDKRPQLDKPEPFVRVLRDEDSPVRVSAVERLRDRPRFRGGHLPAVARLGGELRSSADQRQKNGQSSAVARRTRTESIGAEWTTRRCVTFPRLRAPLAVRTRACWIACLSLAKGELDSSVRRAIISSPTKTRSVRPWCTNRSGG